MFDRLKALLSGERSSSAKDFGEFTRAVRAYAQGLKSTQGRDLSEASIDELAGLVVFDIAMRALSASGHLVEVNNIDEQIALMMFAMLASAPLVVELKKEGHDIEHERVFSVAGAAFTANLDAAGREQVVDLSAQLFERFMDRARDGGNYKEWLAANRQMIWGLVVSDKPEFRQALAAHYIALRAAVAQLR